MFQIETAALHSELASREAALRGKALAPATIVGRYVRGM